MKYVIYITLICGALKKLYHIIFVKLDKKKITDSHYEL